MLFNQIFSKSWFTNTFNQVKYLFQKFFYGLFVISLLRKVEKNKSFNLFIYLNIYTNVLIFFILVRKVK